MSGKVTEKEGSYVNVSLDFKVHRSDLYSPDGREADIAKAKVGDQVQLEFALGNPTVSKATHFVREFQLETNITKRLDLCSLPAPDSAIMALKTQFSQFRFCPFGYDIFFKSAGVALVEKLVCSSGVENLFERCFSVIEQAISTFRLPEGNALHSFLSFIKDAKELRTNAERMRVIDGQLKNDQFVADMVYSMRILAAYSYYANSKMPEFADFLIEAEEFIANVSTMGSVVSEVDYRFLALMLGVKIRIIEVNQERVFVRDYHPEEPLSSIYLVQLGESLFPLVSKQQEFLENTLNPSNVALDIMRNLWDTGAERRVNQLEDELNSKNNDLGKLAAILHLVLEFIQERITEIEGSSTVFNIIEALKTGNFVDQNFLKEVSEKVEKRLCQDCMMFGDNLVNDCGHSFCAECLKGRVEDQTNGLMVLNNYEKQCLIGKEPICKCSEIIHEGTLKALLGDSYENYLKEAIKREKIQNPKKLTCATCRLEKYESEFIEIDPCQHSCKECIVERFISNQFHCTFCNAFSQEIQDQLKLVIEWCIGCNKEKLLIKEFGLKICDHPRLCLECLETVVQNRYCKICDSHLIEPKLSRAGSSLYRNCQKCYCMYKKADEIEYNECFCSICKDCKVKDLEVCASCGENHSQNVKEYLNSFQKEKEEFRKKHTHDCPACGEEKYIDEIRILDCKCKMCDGCLKMGYKFHIGERDIKKACVCLLCGKKLIGIDFLKEVIEKEDFLQLNEMMIRAKYELIQCPKCFDMFEPGENRRVQCRNCNHLLCKDCHEEFHGETDCKEGFIKARIKDLENMYGQENVAQCPGCRVPYSKDESCDHVKCYNDKCGIEFCFSCSCIRSPTMEHANHYHRPDCRFFFALPEEDKPNEKMRPNCSECKKLGRLCNPPKQLRVPRRIDPDET